MHDLIVVGGGAAGAAAAAYALNKHLDTRMLVEDSGKAGTHQRLAGRSSTDYLEGADVASTFHQRIIANDAALFDRVLAVTKQDDYFDVETQQHGTLQSRTVIIATGATPLPLQVPGAQAFVNHGVGYSSATHATLLKDKDVAIVGATPRALRGAAELRRMAKQVYLIVPDATTMDALLAAQWQRIRNVSLLLGYRLTEIVGTTSVERVLVKAADGEQAWLRVDAVFADLGLLPNSGAVRNVVKTDAQAFIWVDECNATSVPGIFAAGDVTTAPGEHILIAMGAGVRAAVSAYDYIVARELLLEDIFTQ